MLMLRHLEMTKSKWLSCVASYKPWLWAVEWDKTQLPINFYEIANSMIVRGGNDSAASTSFTFYTDTL